VDLAMAIFVGAFSGGCGGVGRGLAVGGVFESILHAVAPGVELGVIFGIAGDFLGICGGAVGSVWAGADVWGSAIRGLCAGGEVGELDVWGWVGDDIFLRSSTCSAPIAGVDGLVGQCGGDYFDAAGLLLGDSVAGGGAIAD